VGRIVVVACVCAVVFASLLLAPYDAVSARSRRSSGRSVSRFYIGLVGGVGDNGAHTNTRAIRFTGRLVGPGRVGMGDDDDADARDGQRRVYYVYRFRIYIYVY